MKRNYSPGGKPPPYEVIVSQIRERRCNVYGDMGHTACSVRWTSLVLTELRADCRQSGKQNIVTVTRVKTEYELGFNCSKIPLKCAFISATKMAAKKTRLEKPKGKGQERDEEVEQRKLEAKEKSRIALLNALISIRLEL